MLDPVSLAATAVSLLTPYLQRLGARVAERTTDAIADSALPAVKRLYQVIKDKLRPDTYAGNLLQGAEERPESESRRQALCAALAEELEGDPKFAADLEKLVNEAEEAGALITATDTGAVAGRDFVQRGRYVAGRDMRIGGEDADKR